VFSDARDTLKDALEPLVRAHGLPSCDCSVQILVFGNGRSTYVVRPAEACRVILASQLGCITGRVFLPTEPTFVLFEESLPMILGAADRCAEVYGGARAGRTGRANCEGRKTPFRSGLATSTPGESRKR